MHSRREDEVEIRPWPQSVEASVVDSASGASTHASQKLRRPLSAWRGWFLFRLGCRARLWLLR